MRALGNRLSVALSPADNLQRKAQSDADPCSVKALLCLARLASGAILNPSTAVWPSPSTSLQPHCFSALPPWELVCRCSSDLAKG